MEWSAAKQHWVLRQTAPLMGRSGPPKKWEATDEHFVLFAKLASEYFAQIAVAKAIPTLAGVCLALGTTYARLKWLRNQREWTDLIDWVHTVILEFAEINLYDPKKANGAKFHAMQLGFSEKSVVDSTTREEPPKPRDLSRLSDEELEKFKELSDKLEA